MAERNPKHRGPKPVISVETRDRMVAMCEAGRPIREIAAATGWSYSSVYRICLMAGAEPPNAGPLPTGIQGPVLTMRNGFPVRRFTPEEDARLLDLEARGFTETQIGKELGRQFNTVRGRLATLARREARAEASAAGGARS